MFGASSTINNAAGLSSPPASQQVSTTTQTPTASDFIQLLIAEVENQDPTQPEDPTQYVTQMASLSELQTLNNIQSEIGGSGSLTKASSAYLDHTVTAPGSNIAVSNGKATSIVFTPAAAGTYTAVVTNQLGTQVGQVSLPAAAAGSSQTFSWKPPSGTPNGLYAVQIMSPSGTPLSGLSEQGAVQSVTQSNGSVMLNLGGGLLIPVGSVNSVS